MTKEKLIDLMGYSSHNNVSKVNYVVATTCIEEAQEVADTIVDICRLSQFECRDYDGHFWKYLFLHDDDVDEFVLDAYSDRCQISMIQEFLDNPTIISAQEFRMLIDETYHSASIQVDDLL
jgi:hypothetical protein